MLIPLATADLQELTTAIESAQSELVGQELSGPMAKVFGDTKINLHITLEEGGDVIVGITTINNAVSGISMATGDERDLDVYISEQTINKISSSTDPLPLLLSALENKEITYKAKGFINKIKFAFINVLIKMAGGFAEETTTENVIVEQLPEVEEESEMVEQEDIEPEPIKKLPPLGAEELVEEPTDNEITGNFVAPTINVVNMVDTGFSQPQIVINKGESVTWKNTRSGKVKMAMIVGTQSCRDARSGIFLTGEEFSYTFDKSGSCQVVDGIMTTKLMKVIVR